MAVQGYTQENDDEVLCPSILQRTTAEDFHQMLATLSFPAISITEGDLLEASAGGDFHNPLKTSMHRIYSVGADVLSLYEQDFLSAAATWYVVKETVNSQVHSHPAVLVVMDNSRGKVRVSLSWFTHRMMYGIQQWSGHTDRQALVQLVSARAEDIAKNHGA